MPKHKNPHKLIALPPVGGGGDLVAWSKCYGIGCDDYFCNIHNTHPSECACPPVDHWLTDPYTNTIADEIEALRTAERLVQYDD